MHTTRHAQIRMEQRGINDLMLNLLFEIGETRSTWKARSTMIGKKHIPLLKRKKAILMKKREQLEEQCRALEKLKKGMSKSDI